MRFSRHTAAILAALALPLFGSAGFAQTPAVPSTSRAAPTLPPAASPSVPARIGTPVAPAAAPAAAAATKKIDINAASEQEIATLPGIGPVTAKAIVDGRPWDDLSALTSKKVVNQPTFERNKDRFALANINSSSAADIAKTLPGVGDKTAPKIVNGRPYATPQDLVTKKVLTAAQLAKIKDVITY